MSDNIKIGGKYVWRSPDGPADPSDGAVVTVMTASEAWPNMGADKLALMEKLFPGCVPARFDDLERPIPVHPEELTPVD